MFNMSVGGGRFVDKTYANELKAGVLINVVNKLLFSVNSIHFVFNGH